MLATKGTWPSNKVTVKDRFCNIHTTIPFSKGTATPAVGNRFSSTIAILSASPVPKHEHTNHGLKIKTKIFL